MADYVKKVDLLAAAVEVEYLGRPRMMVSASKIGTMPGVATKQVKYFDEDECVWKIGEVIVDAETDIENNKRSV